MEPLNLHSKPFCVDNTPTGAGVNHALVQMVDPERTLFLSNATLIAEQYLEFGADCGKRIRSVTVPWLQRNGPLGDVDTLVLAYIIRSKFDINQIGKYIVHPVVNKQIELSKAVYIL